MMPERDLQFDVTSETRPIIALELENQSIKQLAGYDAILEPPSRHRQNGYTYPTIKTDTVAGAGNDNDDDGKPQSQDRSEPENKSGFRFFRSLSGRRKYTLVLVTMCTFLSTVVYSFLGPFFSKEAAKKGMNLTLVGVVFGVFELVVFITSPIFGNYLVELGPKFVFITGIFVAGTCNILFGVLGYCPSGTPFIVTTIVVRAVEALGVSAYITSSLAIVSSDFKENVGLAMGIVESMAGLGFMLGPTIGAGLYEAGGFGLPFYCAGCAILLNAVAVFTFLPFVEEISNERKGSLLTLLRSPLIIVSMCGVIVSIIGISASNATLAKRLQPLDLSVGLIGVVFGVLAGLYSVMSTVAGYISDARDTRVPLIITGLLIYGIGYSLTGPSFLLPFIPADSLPVLLIGLALIGAGFGTTIIPTVKCMLIGATEMGFENNLNTYALVAGLYNSMQTLGGFLGPLVAGYLVQKFDFPIGYGLIGLCSLAVMVLLIVFFLLRECKYKTKTGDEETQTITGEDRH